MAQRQTGLRPPAEHNAVLWHIVELGNDRQKWLWMGDHWVPGAAKLTPEQASMWRYVGPLADTRDA